MGRRRARNINLCYLVPKCFLCGCYVVAMWLHLVALVCTWLRIKTVLLLGFKIFPVHRHSFWDTSPYLWYWIVVALMHCCTDLRQSSPSIEQSNYQAAHLSSSITNKNPVSKLWASLRRQSQKLCPCRGKRQRQENFVYTWIPQKKFEILNRFWSAVPATKLYSYGWFERSSDCTLQFPSTCIFPLHNFQKWDCRRQWAFSFVMERSSGPSIKQSINWAAYLSNSPYIKH